ncbi:fructose bisphosphate aldolase [uncultured Jannaschia sp.]|uniref:fructose bisphosphate aldolase n=1 Tax=uncultured Jannaschia sp. TaxID=293347 RepID=UPI00261192AA|nr:fructose bisphosphate aldolase [uncultured Jannaschia sp.]
MSQTDQAAKIRAGQGFVAALDQSGGSTPKALRLYGIDEDRYASDAEMFDLIHAMRERIVTSPAFSGDKVIAAILFEQTMDRDFDGQPAATYLWETRGVVPFLKIDKGLEPENHGVQLMKPIPDLDATLERAKAKGIFGTKERSVIDAADPDGIGRIVDQQFEIGAQVLGHGLVPMLEPEVTISIADKADAETILRDRILQGLDHLPDGAEVMLKLTLPEVDNHYAPLVDHPKVLRVVALSGGYSRAEANDRLGRNRGVIASFSRALTEGLSDDQDEAAFDRQLAETIDSIHAASIAG